MIPIQICGNNLELSIVLREHTVLCVISRILHSAVSAWSGALKAACRRSIKAGRYSSPISLSSRMCGKICPKALPLRRLDAYRIFGCSSGQLVGLCRITIRSCCCCFFILYALLIEYDRTWFPLRLRASRLDGGAPIRITIWSWAIQPLNWVQTDPQKSGESGNFRHRSSGCWRGVGATQATKDSAFANCVLKDQTSSPNCLVSRVISSSACRWSASVPTVPGVLLASSSSCLNASSCCSNVEWSHSGGRNFCVCRSVMCFCNAIICTGWSHMVCTMAACSVYHTTLFNASCASSSSVCLSPKSISSRFLLTIHQQNVIRSGSHSQPSQTLW